MINLPIRVENSARRRGVDMTAKDNGFNINLMFVE